MPVPNRKPISITVLGGGREIGANSYLLDWKGSRILLDCGLDVTKKGYEALPRFDVLGKRGVDAVVITHAHIDHVGSLPIIMDAYLRRGRRVHVTVPSKKLIPLMLMDSAKMQACPRGQGEDYPYEWCLDRQSVSNMLATRSVFAAHAFGEKFRIADGLFGSFFSSGHILGSAGVVLWDGGHSLVYTGDIAKHKQTIHDGCTLPDFADDIDFLLIESTRGSIESDPNNDRKAETIALAGEIKDTLQRNGHVLLPSFALGKTQELIVLLESMKWDGLIPVDTPVLYHHGLSSAINKVYEMYPEYLNGYDPKIISIASHRVTAFNYNDEFKTARELTRVPSIFVFTSGMLSRGSPSARLAEELVQSDKNGIFFTSYVAPEEFGYEVAGAATGDFLQPDLKSDRRIRVICPHRRRFSLSSHATREDLLSIADDFNPRVALWVHGEPDSTEWLSNSFSERHPEALSLQPVTEEKIILTD
jgi:Cft2 family RNA processing exonuclease